jgi:hypothetical protein
VSPSLGPHVADGLVDVRFLGVPVELLVRSREHLDSLERELRLLDVSDADAPAVTHLLELFADPDRAALLPGRAEEDQIEAARRRGEVAVDLVVPVAPTMANAGQDAEVLLSEADRFCRRGQLLNRATPPECVVLRQWYLGEVQGQLGGAPPAPWPG